MVKLLLVILTLLTLVVAATASAQGLNLPVPDKTAAPEACAPAATAPPPRACTPAVTTVPELAPTFEIPATAIVKAPVLPRRTVSKSKAVATERDTSGLFGRRRHHRQRAAVMVR